MPICTWSPGGDHVLFLPSSTSRSVFKNYPYDPEGGREDLEAEGHRVIRGSAFRSGRRVVRCAGRNRFVRCASRVKDVGFRVVVSPRSPPTSENSRP
jgi:formylglycine-generating enzyme required for sulfatase activity